MDKKNMQEAGPPDYYVEGVYESPFKSVFLVIWRYRGSIYHFNRPGNNFGSGPGRLEVLWSGQGEYNPTDIYDSL